jgi:hypothetical protein
MSSWQRRQMTKVLRRRLAMSSIQGFLPPSWIVEVCELAEVVDLKALRALAEFAAPGEEPVDQLVPLGAGHDGPLVGEGGCAHSPEGHPAEAGDQWLPVPVALDDQLQALARPGGGVDDLLALPGHIADRRAVLAREGLEQRGLHDPVQAAQADVDHDVDDGAAPSGFGADQVQLVLCSVG